MPPKCGYMDVKATHKLPISFIAAMVFSATSVNRKCVGNGPSLAERERGRGPGDKKRLKRQGMRKKKKKNVFFFLGECTVI